MKTETNNPTGQRSTFSVLFYLKKSVRKKNGLCPVMGRITVDGESRAFSLRMDADPDLWDAAAGRMTGKSRPALSVNRTIDKYREKIDDCYHAILYSQGYITAEIIKNTLEGRGQKETGLMKLYSEHNKEFNLRIGIDKSHGTFHKYRQSYDRLLDFLRYKYEADDIPLHRLTLSFIEDFDFYLRIERNMTGNTVSGHITHLKKIVRNR
jgi:hypothetical protein